MNIDRQKLLQNLIEKFNKTIYGLHKGQKFPFANAILSQQQGIILFYLFERKDEASVKEIAKFLRVTSGAVTQMIDSLIKKKLVKREENRADRRVVNIKLTEKTESQFEAFKKNYFAKAIRAFRGLNEEEIAQLTFLLGKVKLPDC